MNEIEKLDIVLILETSKEAIVIGIDCKYPVVKLYIEQDNQYLDLELKDIKKTDEKAKLDALLGKRYEISTDVELDNDMDFFEGTFRTPGEFWKLLLARKDSNFKAVKYKKYLWPRTGMETIEAIFPENEAINIQRLKVLLNQYFPNAIWVLVNGPDSMSFR